MTTKTESDPQVRIGARLRAVRQERGLTMSDLAEQTGLTKGFVSQIERDLASASVASLVRICDALDISIGSLFDKPQTNFVPRGQRRPINWGGEGVEEYMLSSGSETQIQVIEQTIAPGGGSGAEAYALKHSDTEFVHVIDGRLEVSVGADMFELGPGDSLTFSAREVHSWRNGSDSKPVHAIWVFSPSII